jgi:hypothetical protein
MHHKLKSNLEVTIKIACLLLPNHEIGEKQLMWNVECCSSLFFKHTLVIMPFHSLKKKSYLHLDVLFIIMNLHVWYVFMALFFSITMNHKKALGVQIWV